MEDLDDTDNEEIIVQGEAFEGNVPSVELSLEAIVRVLIEMLLFSDLTKLDQLDAAGETQPEKAQKFEIIFDPLHSVTDEIGKCTHLRKLSHIQKVD